MRFYNPRRTVYIASTIPHRLPCLHSSNHGRQSQSIKLRNSISLTENGAYTRSLRRYRQQQASHTEYASRPRLRIFGIRFPLYSYPLYMHRIRGLGLHHIAIHIYTYAGTSEQYTHEPPPRAARYMVYIYAPGSLCQQYQSPRRAVEGVHKARRWGGEGGTRSVPRDREGDYQASYAHSLPLLLCVCVISL